MQLNDNSQIKGSKALWVTFHTDFKQIKIVHKADKGFVDMEFAGLGGKTTELRKLFATQVAEKYKVVPTGKSAAVRIEVGKIDFKAELFINVAVTKNVREKVLTSLEVEEDKGKKDKKPSVVIYFCSGGESVWDIARRYNTTVEEIMQENDLGADYLENKRILLIPVK